MNKKIFVTSDIHFFHKKILQFCEESRPFESVEHMHDIIINNWNNIITKDDDIYILGDITFGSVQKTIDLMDQLNGTKILIKGNHDHSHLRKTKFQECFASIHDYLEIKHNGVTVVMCHYPIAWWNKRHHHSIMIHGHLHGNKSGVDGRIKDVGMDTNSCTPYLLDDVLEELSTIKVEVDHHNNTLEG
jgi:calcineurin-like phosphoesterase family protein